MVMTLVSGILIVIGVILVLFELVNPGGYLGIPGAVLSTIGTYGVLYPSDIVSWTTLALSLIVATSATLATVYAYWIRDWQYT